MRIFSFTLVLLVAGCSVPPRIVEPLKPASPMLPGVDSTQIQMAWQLAEASFARDAEAAARAAEEGRRLAALADSLLPPVPVSQVRDTARALVLFHAGVDLLEQYSETDSLQALELLKNAAAKFEEALEADAFDDEARQWLARLYQTLAERFQQIGAIQDQLRVLQRLVMWNQDRHDYIALLAAAQGEIPTEASGMTAGALWERAAQVALDDAEMGLRATPDSAALFAYHVRASRAFVVANRGLLARASLSSAQIWQRTEQERALIHADSIWLDWDDGNLTARKRFDVLLSEVSVNPEKAAGGLLDLLESVQNPDARIQVRHQLALARYASGSEEQSVRLMQALVREDPHQRKLAEDYAVMAYNLAQQLRRGGDLRGALAYLLQCASLDAQIAARAAFDAALLLRNNLDAAIRYAHMAEARIDTLDQDERNALFRYLAELYRRNGDRHRAREYIGYLAGS
ncbi:MAG: hypothetical protein OXI05_09140 [Bacteroidota bacterium]|nr:hypothetical protein [Bacteroidota bacterium]MDE2645987.1 hypothetical protein [Bacteroidota bacterium]MXW33954.1 hypothetical protein [Rhodothermaceae bacterium]MYE63731.1 hypothetical protein [Rhodothermaceae bacterium]MYJ21542.1 hypothetical protein [Rhodothermaceae bacterium]